MFCFVHNNYQNPCWKWGTDNKSVDYVNIFSWLKKNSFIFHFINRWHWSLLEWESKKRLVRNITQIKLTERKLGFSKWNCSQAIFLKPSCNINKAMHSYTLQIYNIYLFRLCRLLPSQSYYSCQAICPQTSRNSLSGICTAGMYSQQFQVVDCVRGTSKAFYTQNVLLRREWRKQKNKQRGAGELVSYTGKRIIWRSYITKHCKLKRKYIFMWGGYFWESTL